MLLETSPHILSVCFINEPGNVIPTFTVLSYIVLAMLIQLA